MALGVGTTDKILGKVADKVGVLSDTVKGSNKQLKGAIDYNTALARKAEENRINLAEQSFENAKETLREFEENKRINLKNQKRFENLLENGKLEGKRRAEAEAKLLLDSLLLSSFFLFLLVNLLDISEAALFMMLLLLYFYDERVVTHEIQTVFKTTYSDPHT